MSIEIQHHQSDRPEIIERILHLVAPRGWNANTQFFLVFLVVLGVHLWVAPVLMRSAADLEPGDPQGYFSSHGNEAASPDSGVPKLASDSEEAPNASEPKPIGFEKDTLILADATIVARPITESKPKEGVEIKAPVSPEPEVALASVAEAPHVAEAAADSAATVEESPVNAVAEAPEAEKAQPRLSDLIVEAPSADRMTSAGPANSAKPDSAPAKPASSEGMRQFRQLR